jgi:hypothetical protein
MKDLLNYLPKILEVLPKIIKYVPVILIIAGIGYAAYIFYSDFPPLFVCHDNEIYELQWGSKVYKFKGGYCIQM